MENTQNSKVKIRDVLISLLTAALFSVFLPIFMYTNNIEEASFREVFPLILLFAGIGAGIFGILFFCFRKNLFLATVTSIMLILVLSNYALIEKALTAVLPKMDFPSIMLLSVCIIALIVLALNKYVNSAVKDTVSAVLLAVVSVLILLNIVTALPKGIQKLTVPQDIPTELPPVTEVESDDLPNVYYLLFDECSNSEIMKKYYDYDNSAFDGYLENKGFAVSQNTMNGSWDTSVITTNYANYEYIVNDDTLWAARTNLRENSRLVKLFESNGYKITGVGGSQIFGVPSLTQTDEYLSSTKEGDTLSLMILKNTAYKAFYTGDDYIMGDDIKTAVNYFNKDNLEKYGSDNVFTVFYVCCPHEPFLFNQDGEVDITNRSNWEDKSYYLNQYIYMTKMMEQMIDNILATDEDCVIILQSDHAARGVEGITEEDKMKPLNAVYYRGEDISEIEGQSGVNTIRLVLNRLFDMDLEVLKVTE